MSIVRSFRPVFATQPIISEEWKRPRLAGHVGHASDLKARLLEKFAPNGGLDVFSHLDEPGERRISPWRIVRLTTEQQLIFMLG